MDERLEAGRHHLINGEKALREGYPDDSRAHFEAALLQFRGPELRLGEAHALRGLGSLDVSIGDLRTAEKHFWASVNGYEGLLRQLAAIDPQGVSADLVREAREGEAASLIALSDVLVRIGRGHEARDVLRFAGGVAKALGDVPLVGEVWSATARLATRYKDLDRALQSVHNALRIHQANLDLEGEVTARIQLAELQRLLGDFVSAETTLKETRPLAEDTGNALLDGRVLDALATLKVLAGRPEDAVRDYQQALGSVQRAGDEEMEAVTRLGLGDAQSRVGDEQALHSLVAAARIYRGLGRSHGFAKALLRIGEHGIRSGDPELGLLGAIGAIDVWRSTDPVHGVGIALRVAVKAMAAAKAWRGALVTAMLRNAVAGHVQPNAKAVAEFYSDRAPLDWVEDLEKLSHAELASRHRAAVARLLRPVLTRAGVESSSLGALGALQVVEHLLEAPLVTDEVPRPAEPAPPAMAAKPPDEEEETEAYVLRGGLEPPDGALPAPEELEREVTEEVESDDPEDTGWELVEAPDPGAIDPDEESVR